MANFIDGLGLASYRGIGQDLQTLAPLGQVNLLIGPNNAGKSIVLEFLSRHLLQTKAGAPPWSRAYDKNEVHQGLDSSQIVFGLGVPLKFFVEQIDALGNSFLDISSKLIADAIWSEQVWMKPSHDGRSLVFMNQGGGLIEFLPVGDNFDQSSVRTLWIALTNQSGGSYQQHWLPESISRMVSLIAPSLPSAVTLIPAIRQIGGQGQEFVDCSGSGLIDRLAELQNPPHDERYKRKTFDSINNFLREVTNTDDAQIEIPHDRRHILVSMHGRVLPLSYLGTGIHEVIMLASFCTLATDQVVCIEEPEIHLHPLLQKKLVAYLQANTSNQYFIATHSASLLDTAKASIFSVSNEGGATHIRLATSDNEKFHICQDLGFRASDLLQANCVIWVEGPSDRIYLRAWISKLAPQLIEGVQYTTMFYGGRLLSHLAADDPEVGDFISLRRMNRRSFIIIDSDKNMLDAPINATKQRVADDFGTGFFWITEGREIENYVDEDTLSSAKVDVYGDRVASAGQYGPYERVSYFNDIEGVPQKSDKVKLAHAVAARPIELISLDLLQRVEALVEFIQLSNG